MGEAEFLAACLARGRPREVCDDELAEQTVDGVFCDGNVFRDESGKRCIPADIIERTDRAREATPLPESSSSSSTWILVGGALLFVAVAGIVIINRRGRR